MKADDDQVSRPADDPPPLQTISTFARAVGLSASALRLYAENGLVTPAEVDERTGYRYYTPPQQRRAIWVRRLREAGLPLSQIKQVLDGSTQESDDVIDTWLGETRAQAAHIQGVTDDLRHSLHALREPSLTQRTEASLDSEQLAAALGQVARASAPPGDPSGLDGILLEIQTSSVAVVATDRRLMLARTALPADVNGSPARVQVGVLLDTALPWLADRTTVTIAAERGDHRDDQRAELRDASGARLSLALATDRFPSCAQILSSATPCRTRIVLPLADVHRVTALAEGPDPTLRAGNGGARLTLGEVVVQGRHVGADLSLQVARSALHRIAGAAVGDRLVCDVRSVDEPLLWSAPSQPDFAAGSMALG